MKVVYGIGSRRKAGPSVVTVGVFDGVHKGHRRILQSVVREARAMGLESAVVTFVSHPSHYFHPHRKVPALTSLEHKLFYIKKEGIDTCYVLKFDARLSKMGAEDFIEALVRRIGMRSLYVGEDFIFGRGGRGDAGLLKKLAEKFGFSAHILKHLRSRERIISSTLIRSLIAKGDLKTAEAFLGRRVSFLGRVIKGEGRGRTLGFPTANIRPQHEVLVPDGIYASETICGHRISKSVTYIGSKPTFKKNNKRRSIEVHLMGRHKDLYGRKLEVRIISMIRGDKRFSSAGELVTQIKKDVAAAKTVFSRR